MSNVLYEGTERSVCGGVPRQHDVNLGRWERILSDKDDAKVWKAIDWKGNFTRSSNNDRDCPSDIDFKDHFERVLNRPNVESVPQDINTYINIPVLDDPISLNEVEFQIGKLKVDKACGMDGLSPCVDLAARRIDFSHHYFI